MRIIVAGSGIVGLTTAIALKSIGADVIVCEQASEVRAAGAAIGLWPNAMDVFAEFGVGQAIADIGRTVDTWFYDAAGRKFRADGFGEADHRFLLVPRPELNRTLAAALDGCIRLDARVVAFEEHDAAVTVTLSNGETLDADLLVGADGVYSMVRRQMLPEHVARHHEGHHVWRGLLPSGLEPNESNVLTVGHQRVRGGYARTSGNQVMWMINQFNSELPTGTRKEEALKRAVHLNDNGWVEPLLRLIEATPEEAILHNPIMYVPSLPRWTSQRVVLIGDAAHGLSPHIAAGGTLGVEDVRVLVRSLVSRPHLAEALAAYEANRMPHYDLVHAHADAVESSRDAYEYAHFYARFSHWMLNDGASTARI